MTTSLLRSAWLASAALALAACGTLALLSQKPSRAAAPAVGARSPALPPFFVPNRGQAGDGARFLLPGPGYRAEFLEGHVRFSAGSQRWQVNFQGARPGSGPSEGEPLEARVSYLVGRQPDPSLTGLPAYASIVYREIYPAIDLVYSLHNGQLKADFHVRPGGHPSSIRWRYEGVERVGIEPDGALLVWTGSGVMREDPPRIYQVRGGVERPVRGGFRRLNELEFGFWVEDYDPQSKLVIDPVLSYSTLLGGSGLEVVRALAADAAGNLYLAGYTDSPNFPVSNALQSARGAGVEGFVAKLSPSGSLLYCTYLGGSGDDRAFAVAVDGAGSAYLAGWTYSPNFPVTSAAPQRTLRGGRDAFVAKLTPAGTSLAFSTYLGGASHDSANAIAVDSSGQAVVAGDTFSSDFPTAYPFQSSTGGRQDAFVAKLNPAGSALAWSTYLGGGGDDRANGVAVDSGGAVYLTGGTFSTNFPVWQARQSGNAGGQDAFLTKLSADGRSLIYSTYLGGSGGSATANEAGMAVQTDAAGSAYVAGVTSSANFPVVNALRAVPGGGGVDAFLAKLNPSGSALAYSTYLGGSSQDYALALAVAPSGLAAVAGYTSSPDFPVREALQAVKSGGYDAFVARLRPDGGALEMSTYWGGSDSDAAYAVAMDRAGNLWIAGQTLSADYPLLRAFQTSDPGAGSAFAARIVDRTPVAAFRGADNSVRLLSFADGVVRNAGGFIASKVTVSQSPLGHTYVAARTNGNQLWINRLHCGTGQWSGWSYGGQPFTGNPAVVATPDEGAMLIARDALSAYWINRFDPSIGFIGGWRALGGSFSSDPSATSLADSKVAVSGIDSGGVVWAGVYDRAAGFQGWISGGRPGGTQAVGQPAVTQGSDGAVYVAVRTSDNSVWVGRLESGRWSPWNRAGGGVRADPSIAAGDGSVYILLNNAYTPLSVRPFRTGPAGGWLDVMPTVAYLQDAELSAPYGRLYIVGRDWSGAVWWYDAAAGVWTYYGFSNLVASSLSAAPR